VLSKLAMPAVLKSWSPKFQIVASVVLAILLAPIYNNLLGIAQ